jgi:hypothetical protein
MSNKKLSPFGKGGIEGDFYNLLILQIPLPFGHLPFLKGE